MTRPTGQAFDGTLLAGCYDRIYSFKDYRAEARRLEAVTREYLRSGGRRLLDVACGTGGHLAYLKDRFDVTGVDRSAAMLAVARRRLPGTKLHRADMTGFELGERFDVVTCLFSSIGYVKTVRSLNRAVATMARHLVPGGVLLVEPWFTPGAWMARSIHVQLLVDEPGFKLVRANTSLRRGRLSWFDLHHLVCTRDRTRHLVERHELGLFTTREMKQAFRRCGLGVAFDPEGLTGRGLYIGTRSRSPRCRALRPRGRSGGGPGVR